MDAAISPNKAGDARPDIATLLCHPNVSINGAITNETLTFFLGRLGEVLAGEEDLILELDTYGGDADVARRIALELTVFKSIAAGGHGAWERPPSIRQASPSWPRFLALRGS
jgi:hypothetical protein